MKLNNSMVNCLTNRILKLKNIMIENGYCFDEFKDIMADILTKVFTKGQTRIIINKQDISKSIANYLFKKKNAEQNLIIDLITEIEEKISHFSSQCEQKQAVEPQKPPPPVKQQIQPKKQEEPVVQKTPALQRSQSIKRKSLMDELKERYGSSPSHSALQSRYRQYLEQNQDSTIGKILRF